MKGDSISPVTKYICSKCKAVDYDKGYNLPAPATLNCWKCGAGRGLGVNDSFMQREGMFPEQQPE